MAWFLSIRVIGFGCLFTAGRLAGETVSVTGWSQVQAASVSTGCLSLCHCVQVSLSKTLKHDLLLTCPHDH